MVTIRDAAEDDIIPILDIYNEVILNTTAVYSEEPHTLQMRQDWYHDRKKNNFPVYVADADARLQGFAVLDILGYGPVIGILLKYLFMWRYRFGVRALVKYYCRPLLIKPGK